MKPKSIIQVLVFAAGTNLVHAANLYWDGAANTNLGQSDNTTTTAQTWFSGGFWDNGSTSAAVTAWTAGDSAIFGGSAATQTITAGTLTIGNMTFGSGADGSGTSGTNYTITGGTLTLSSPTTVTTNTDTTISSTIAATANALTKTGNATLNLSGVCNYTGATTVNQGKLVISTTANDRFKSSGTGAISIAAGATFEVATGTSSPRLNPSALTIVGAGTLTKTGTGTVFLANGAAVEQFNLSAGGLVNVSAGTISDYGTAATNLADLTVASGATIQQGKTATYFNALNGGGTFANANNQPLNFGVNNGSGTFTGNISGGGTFTKTGSGTQKLGGSNTYTGATAITGGILELASSGTMAATDITVKNTATFQIDSSGKTLKSLAVENGSTLVLPASGVSTTLLTNGLTLTSTPSFTVKPMFSTTPLTGNTFDLITASSATGSVGTITTDLSSGGLTRVAGSTAVSGNKIVLTITSGAGALTWSNATATGVWNFNGDANFSGATPGTFLTYDGVTFGNTAAGNVSLVGNLAPGSVTVDASADYTFSGSGSITGATALTKTGTGILTLQNANSHVGGIVLNNGTLALGNAAALGTGVLILNGGTLDSATPGLVLTTNNAQSWAADFSFAGSNDLNLGTGTATLTGNRQITVTAGTLTVGGTITGSSLGVIKTGPGTLSLTGSNTYTGTTTVSAGTLLLKGNANSLTNAAYNIGASGVVAVDTGTSDWTVRNGLTFSGSTGTLRKLGTGTLALGGGDYFGNFNMAAGGVLDVQTGTVRCDWGYNKSGFGSNLGSLNVASGAVFDIWDLSSSGGTPPQFDLLTGSGDIDKNALANSVNVGTTQLTIGVNNGSGTFAGALKNSKSASQTINLVKTGTGNQAFTGTSPFAGTTTVNNGTLTIEGAFPNSPVTVNTNGTLAGTGSVKSAAITGVISPGGNAIGTLTVNNALALNPGSTTVCQIDKTGVDLTSDQLYVTSVTYGGTLKVTSTGSTLQAGDTFLLFDAAPGSAIGTFNSYDLPALPAGLSWEVANLTVDGTISVVNRTPTPVFNPSSGGYVGGRTVNITSDSGSTVYYTFTTDGSTPADPTTSSSSGTAAAGFASIVVPSDADYKVKAFATKPGYSNSLIAEAEYHTLTTPTWTYDGGGSWSDPFNWQKSIIPDGSGITADFSTRTLADNSTVSIDSARTLGTLILADQGNQYDWTLSGSTLTMAGITPEIRVLNRTTHLASSLAGTDPVNKTGAGTLHMTGVAINTGTTNVNNGRLIFSTGGDNRFNGSGGLAIASGATFEINSTASARFAPGTGSITGAGNLEKTGNFVTYMANGASHQVINMSSGGLIWVKEGIMSDYETSSSNKSDLSIESGATLQWPLGVAVNAPGAAYFDSLNGAGTILMGGTTFNVGVDNGNGSFSGHIGAGSNTLGSLSKQGTGTLTLSGDSLYSGGTTVNSGTLAVNNTTGSATGSGTVTVKTSATLSGTGSIAGDTTVESGGSIAPGNSGIGTLTIASATLAGTYQCEIGASTCDQLVITGALTGSPGATLAFSTSSTPTAAEYVVATYGSISGNIPVVTGVPTGYSLDTNTAGVIKLVSTAAGFQGWIDGFASLTNPADKLPNADPDHDGVSNILEFVLDADPTNGSVTHLPGVSVSGGNLVFTFTRRDDAEYLNPAVEFDADLQGPWTTAVNGVNCTINVSDNASAPDTVTVTIPKGSNARLFSRLSVTH